MAGAAVSEAAIKLLLKDEERLPAELEHLQRSELESLRTAIDNALARRPAEPVVTNAESVRDDGFSCEWWPPS
jgi:hypothetical protein